MNHGLCVVIASCGWLESFVCWLGAERNRILNYGYPASRTSLCLWHIGWDADMADGAQIYFSCQSQSGMLRLSGFGSQRQPTESRGSKPMYTIYRRRQTTKIRLVLHQHNPQPSDPIRDSRHMLEDIWIRDEFFWVWYYVMSKDPRAIRSIRILPEHRKVRGNPRCLKSPLPYFLYLFIRGN